MAQHGQTQSGPSPSRLLTTTTTTTTSLTETDTAATATGIGSHGSHSSSGRPLLRTASAAAHPGAAASHSTGLGPAPPPRPPTSGGTTTTPPHSNQQLFSLTAPRVPARPPGQARGVPNTLLPLPPRASVRLSSESSLPVAASAALGRSPSPASPAPRVSPVPRAHSTPLTFPSRSPPPTPVAPPPTAATAMSASLHHLHLHSHILHTAAVSPPPAASELITLTQPRPDGERARNEYIDTPLKGGLGSQVGSGGLAVPHKPAPGSRLASHSLHAQTHVHVSGAPHAHLALVSTSSSVASHPAHALLGGPAVSPASATKRPTTASPALKRSLSTRRSGHKLGSAALPTPVTQQPGSLTFTKDPGCGGRGSSPDAGHAAASAALVTCSHTECLGGPGGVLAPGRDSIICPVCGRCRCEACRTPKALPSRWLCNDKCLCSAEACLDYVSCLCCVKGLFYHCSASDDGGSCADRPCSCGPSKCWTRWACLASLSLVLPCLACYWPLKGCVRLTELCYQRCTQHGCRCEEPGNASAAPATVTTGPVVGAGTLGGRTSSTRIPSSVVPGPSDKRLLDNE